MLAVWVDGALYSTSTKGSRKGRNLAADPRCTVTARTDIMDVVLEGTATQVTITPATVFGFGTADDYAGRATRYRF